MKKDDDTGCINYDCNVCSRVGKFVRIEREKIIGMLSLFVTRYRSSVKKSNRQTLYIDLF